MSMNSISCPNEYTIEWSKHVVPCINKIKDKYNNPDYCFDKHYNNGIQNYNTKLYCYEKYVEIYNSLPPNLTCDELNAINNKDVTFFIIKYFKDLKDEDI